MRLLTVEASPRSLLFLRSFSTFWLCRCARVFGLIRRRPSLLSVRGGAILLPGSVVMLTRADCWAGAGGDGGGPSDGVRTGHGDHRCWMQTVAGVRSSVRVVTACLGRQDCRRAREVGMSVHLILSVLHPCYICIRRRSSASDWLLRQRCRQRRQQ